VTNTPSPEAQATIDQLAERFGFSAATIDRALQVLRRGTESEITAVLEGKHRLENRARADPPTRARGGRGVRPA
jgi:hypothetical protein